jgi:hypothetical protein
LEKIGEILGHTLQLFRITVIESTFHQIDMGHLCDLSLNREDGDSHRA